MVSKTLKSKNCIKCNSEFLTGTDKQKFCTNKCSRDSWNEVNAEKKKQQAYAWKANNPDKAKEIKLKRYYGITIERYRLMETEQNLVCKICKRVCSSGRELCVDHCHKTGKIRGLLCGKCNTGLGSFNDNTESLLEAIKYLGDGDVN